MLAFAPYCSIDTQKISAKPKNPFRKTNMGQLIISYIGPSLWNSLPDSIKKANSLNTFKHNFKKHCKLNNKFVYMHMCMCINK